MLEDINQQENAQQAIRLYPIIVSGIMYQAAYIAKDPLIDSKGQFIEIRMPEQRKKKLSKRIAALSKEHKLMKEKAYYHSKEMSTLCQGTEDIMSLEYLLTIIPSLWLELDKAGIEALDKN